MQTTEQATLLETSAALTVKIIGVGNAGDAMLSALDTQEFATAQFNAVKSDAAELAA